MLRILGIINMVITLLGCSSSSSPTPRSGTDTPQVGTPTSSTFYPVDQNYPGGANGCIGTMCQQSLDANSHGPAVPMLVDYIYGENSVRISIKSDVNPNWSPINFQAGVQTIPNICNPDGTSIVDIQFQSDVTYTDADEKCVVGYKEGNSFYVGTDDECDETYGEKNYHDITDEILKFTCQGNITFSFRHLRLNPRIDLKRWLRGDGDNRL